MAYGTLRRRQRRALTPARPIPSSERDAGSGTGSATGALKLTAAQTADLVEYLKSL
jgi:hypothetical protein